MPIYQVIVLAIIQAVTEFLPISSSAHLELVPWLFGWKDPGLTFDVALHVGTLVAILIYFFKDWVQIVGQGFGLNIGTDPELNGIVGCSGCWLLLPFPSASSVSVQQAGGKHLAKSYVIGSMLIVIGIVMWIADRSATGKKDMGNVSWGDGMWTGIAQALAVVPGTSRSGITITPDCSGG